MRLIDADELLKEFDPNGERLDPILVRSRIVQQPTAYNVEKVVAELEQQAEQYRNRGFEHEQKGFSKMADKYYGKQCSYLHAIDIVKRGGVE